VRLPAGRDDAGLLAGTCPAFVVGDCPWPDAAPSEAGWSVKPEQLCELADEVGTASPVRSAWGASQCLDVVPCLRRRRKGGNMRVKWSNNRSGVVARKPTHPDRRLMVRPASSSSPYCRRRTENSPSAVHISSYDVGVR